MCTAQNRIPLFATVLIFDEGAFDAAIATALRDKEELWAVERARLKLKIHSRGWRRSLVRLVDAIYRSADTELFFSKQDELKEAKAQAQQR